MTRAPFRAASFPLVLILAAIPAAAPAALHGQPAPVVRAHVPADAAERVDAIFERWDSAKTPGCAVGVAEGGETILTRSYGMADLEHGVPSTPETIYEAGSVSKQFTAAAVVLLALDGELSLDDDVRAYVPEVPDYGHTITIRHLLNHTSGLRDWGSVAALSGWGRSVRTHSHDHVLDIVSRQSELNYPPGEAYSYTNSGYNLMAVIVERVSGTSFADFSRERLFEPLGLSSTRWRDDYRRLVPGRATAYSPRGDGFVIDQPIEHVHGNGGLLTTVEDLLAWTESLEAGTLAGPGFVELMHDTGVLNNGRPITYAAGLQVGSFRGVPQVSHTGATSGYRAYLARYPAQGLAVAMLCNVSAVSTGGTGNAVSEVFLRGLPEGDVPAPEAVSVPARDLRATVGLYRNRATGAPLRLALDEGELRVEGGPTLWPISPNEFQVGSGERRFTLEAGPDGERPLIREAVGAWDEATYEPVEDFDPGIGELAEYVGEYHSPDAEANLVVAVEGGELVMSRRPASRFRLDPVYPDAFRTSLGLVRFHRDRDGTVSALGLSQPRVHDIRFRRDAR
jgi:CubicO group peptidase (beta-lactamase class C family)